MNKVKKRSKKHREWVASQPCSIKKGGIHCCIEPIHCDHLMRAGGHSMGSKESDEWCVSLCWKHHHEKTITGNEKIFWLKYGYNWSQVLNLAIWFKENSPCHIVNPKK